MDVTVASLLVLFSVSIRSFIVNKNGTLSSIADILFGLPVDLTIVAFSFVIYSSNIIDKYINNQPFYILSILFCAVLQIGLLYRPCLEFRDSGNVIIAFMLFVLNGIITFILYIFMLGVIK